MVCCMDSLLITIRRIYQLSFLKGRKRLKIGGSGEVSDFLKRNVKKDNQGSITYRDIHDRYNKIPDLRRLSYSRFTQLLREHLVTPNSWIEMSRGGGGAVVLKGVRLV